MPYQGFEQNEKLQRTRKIKTLGEAVATLDEAVRDLELLDAPLESKTLQRRAQALRFVSGAATSGQFTTEELTMIEKAVHMNVGRLVELHKTISSLIAASNPQTPSK